ncbi:MAG: cation-translocating P-type ATPase, partial [Candidatus Margulisiibacteriota bacterium]
GDNVPADARLIYVSLNFTTQEASLTGESFPVAKTAMALNEEEIPLAERANLVYMGTTVASGRARALVAETGMRTELGKIAGMIQGIEEETTPLQKKLEQFGKWMVYACFILVAIVFLLEMIRGGTLLDVFLTAVSLAVAAIPEGLPAIVTIALALGVQRMVKRHALIRKLHSVETLGSTTVICSDKTGTLTKNEMTVKSIYAGGVLFEVSGIGYEPEGDFSVEGRNINPQDQPQLKNSLLCGVLCNSSELAFEDGKYKIIGDPTEGAILVCAGKAGLSKKELENRYPMIGEIPFDPARKKMTIIRRDGDHDVVYVKGAPDVLINNCVGLDDQTRKNILEMNDTLTKKAMRVLAVASKRLERLPDGYNEEILEKELDFLGLIAMIDPPRKEAQTAISRCREAGIKTVMITGDHKNTAAAIAGELGFYDRNSIALTGEELDKLSDEDFYDKVGKATVYARVSPEHKLRIVRALRKRGEIVAMTGDGVNDAPALKESDIGVAMGITGTDVAKEVSDMIITDDNFSSIVAAVEEGRGIYNNIKKFVHYLISCNIGEILVMFTASVAGLPIPLFPIQILWVNLVTDGFPALALGVDPVNPNVMKMPPRNIKEGVVTRDQAVLMFAQGAFIAACSLFAFSFILFVEHGSLARARTVAFIVLAAGQLFHSFNCRDNKESIFKLGIFTNKSLIIATLFSFVLLVMTTASPMFQMIFKTEYLSVFDWVLVIVVASLPLWIMEFVKKIRCSHD